MVFTFEEKIQNAVGNIRVQKGDDMFDSDFGIDYRYLASLGSQEFGQAYLKSSIAEKMSAENLQVIEIEVTTFVYPYWEVNVSYFQDEVESILTLKGSFL